MNYLKDQKKIVNIMRKEINNLDDLECAADGDEFILSYADFLVDCIQKEKDVDLRKSNDYVAFILGSMK